jgi:hypothetical protein
MLPLLLLATCASAANLDDLKQKGKEDSTTMVEYSLLVYYTAEGRAETKDISAFINKVVLLRYVFNFKNNFFLFLYR